MGRADYPMGTRKETGRVAADPMRFEGAGWTAPSARQVCAAAPRDLQGGSLLARRRVLSRTPRRRACRGVRESTPGGGQGVRSAEKGRGRGRGEGRTVVASNPAAAKEAKGGSQQNVGPTSLDARRGIFLRQHIDAPSRWGAGDVHLGHSCSSFPASFATQPSSKRLGTQKVRSSPAHVSLSSRGGVVAKTVCSQAS